MSKSRQTRWQARGILMKLRAPEREREREREPTMGNFGFCSWEAVVRDCLEGLDGVWIEGISWVWSWLL